MKDVMIGTWAWGPGNNGSKMVFGQSYDENSLRENFDEAVRLGLIKWDTAAVYGMGSCEKLLGKFINGREDIFLSTKYFPNKKFRTGDLEKSFEESMTRLGLSSADSEGCHTSAEGWKYQVYRNIQRIYAGYKDGRRCSV